ncbi:class I SAM-dependent methyltransferase [Bacteroidales bacterium OttesenSCG-928-M06]|nr:class I SAM-dependent methyltransferase [Bacteroidales bacterium OttesenSCG-928-M06]
MFDTKEKFEYLECSVCGCVQIKSIPQNTHEYYPNSYYSFNQKEYGSKAYRKIKDFLISQYVDYLLGNKKNLLGFLASKRYSARYYWLTSSLCSRSSKILDIGCGSGLLIREMRKHGFNNIIGIDPYIEDDIYWDKQILVERKDVFQVNDKFDFIMLHHSFEHMNNQIEVMHGIYKILNPSGYVLIRIPVVGYAFEKYQENWYQLDAPRHFFLHTLKSMQTLAEKTGFEIKEVLFDSNESQFINSEIYLKGSNAVNNGKDFFDKKQIKEFKANAKELNLSGKGDQACFYLYKK